MRLTDHTDYSLRTLMYLNQQKRLVTLSELSEKIEVSRNNLIKVSNQLSKLNWVDATRGRSGGLQIKPEIGSISLKDIIGKTEETFRLADCFSKKKCACTFLPSCLLKKALSGALDAFLKNLDDTTLDDVTPKK